MDATRATQRPETGAQALAGLAQASLRWALLWAGWLWAGRLGANLGWDWAGGLGLPALWWGALLAGRHPSPSRWLGPVAARSCLWVAALAVLASARLGGGWLPLAAAAWGLAAAALQPPGGCASRRGAGAAPALGGLVAGVAVLALPVWGAALLLAGAAVLPWRPSARVVPRVPKHGVPELAMGLMMGTTWLAGDWCSTAGWAAGQLPAIHLAWMACLPAVLATARALLPRRTGPDTPALLLVAAGLCAQWRGAEPEVLAMVLASLAWAWGVALPGCSMALRLPPWLGPAALLAIGWSLPAWGPQAWVAAQGAVGLLAGASSLVTTLGSAVRRSAPDGFRRHPTRRHSGAMGPMATQPGVPMPHQALIHGDVCFRAGDGMPMPVPDGPVDIEVTDDAATLSWSEGADLGSAAITRDEFERHVREGRIRILAPA